MPKIKLIEHGFSNVTGLIGNIEFENGVSVESVSTRDAERLGAIMRVENAETDEELNVAKGIETRLRATPKTRPQSQTEKTEDKANSSDSEGEKSSEGDAEKSSDTDTAQTDADVVYTDAMLGNIADESGIAGLREVAKKFDVTDKTVRGLITKILKAQQDKQ